MECPPHCPPLQVRGSNLHVTACCPRETRMPIGSRTRYLNLSSHQPTRPIFPDSDKLPANTTRICRQDGVCLAPSTVATMPK